MTASVIAFLAMSNAHHGHPNGALASSGISLSVVLQWLAVFAIIWVALQIVQRLAEAIGHLLASLVAVVSAVALLFVLGKLFVYARHLGGVPYVGDYEGVIVQLTQWIDKTFQDFMQLVR